MSYKFYEYKNCSTCKQALKYLDAHDIPYSKHAIRETPPTKSELKRMLVFVDYNTKKLFNTSGQDYRSLGLKDKIDSLSKTEVFDLLSTNGNLVKRPFLLGKNWGAVGFKPDIWDEHL